MIERKFEIATADGTADAVIYTPGEEAYPGVLFYTDIFGIRPANQGMARRVAEEGYAVLMPNVFYRYGKPPFTDAGFQWGEPASMKIIDGLFGSLTGAMMEKDAPLYVKALLEQPEVSGDRVGVVGYCFTGAFALRTAAVVAGRVAAASGNLG